RENTSPFVVSLSNHELVTHATTCGCSLRRGFQSAVQNTYRSSASDVRSWLQVLDFHGVLHERQGLLRDRSPLGAAFSQGLTHDLRMLLEVGALFEDRLEHVVQRLR